MDNQSLSVIEPKPIPVLYKDKIDAMFLGNKLPEADQIAIRNHFADFLEQIEPWETEALSIVITDESDTKGMKRARAIRLDLKKIRIEIDKRRKEIQANERLKVDTTNMIARFARETIEGLEKHCEDQEKYAEIQEGRRRDALRQERIARLSEFGDVNVPNLAVMTDQQFEDLYETTRKAHLFDKEQQEREAITQLKVDMETERRINARTQQISALGYQFDGSVWYVRGSQSISLTAMRDLDDSSFETMVQSMEVAKSETAADTPVIEQPEQTVQTWITGDTDEAKLGQLVDVLTAIEWPEMETDGAREAVAQARSMMNDVILTGLVMAQTKLVKEPLIPSSVKCKTCDNEARDQGYCDQCGAEIAENMKASAEAEADTSEPKVDIAPDGTRYCANCAVAEVGASENYCGHCATALGVEAADTLF